MDVLASMLGGLRRVCAGFTDVRRGQNITHSMHDAGMAAFSLFFMQSESFLEHQRSLETQRHRSNCQTLFGMEKIPSDNHIRNLLDEVDPKELQPCFDEIIAIISYDSRFDDFKRLEKRTLIALDGTEYFCSQKLKCPSCQTRKRSNGAVESYHSMLCATIVAPGNSRVIPLMPEFITPQDGHAKQDCEREAAKRWLSEHSSRLAALNPVYLGDDLFACQPLAQQILASGADFIFTCKPDSHKTLYEFLQGAEMAVHSTIDRGGKKAKTTQYQWVEGLPIRDGKDALMVNFISVKILNSSGKVTYHNSFITRLAVTKANVGEIVACGRARWKIENESFNVLKNNGYHLEHNFGHGKQNLAMVFAAMNLLAFAMHTVCDGTSSLWSAARTAKGARRRFFEHLRTVTVYIVFPTWNALFHTLITNIPPPQTTISA